VLVVPVRVPDRVLLLSTLGRAQALPDEGEVEGSGQSQGPGEGPPLLGEVDAPGVEVHGGSPPGTSACGVGHEHPALRDDAQQL
jgi:hypothetical protein